MGLVFNTGVAMKVNNKILSIPPYISTAWRNISSLRQEADVLVVELFNGSLVSVPNLDEEALSTIFSAHENYLEAEVEEESSLEQAISHLQNNNDQMIGLPMRFGMDGMESAMQHDPSQQDAPDLPQEILEKIAGISQVIGIESVAAIPQAEQNCNCFHCQIARAIARSAEPAQEETEEIEVSDEELTFREWDIKEEGEKLYLVSNPLEESEQYRVYLGEPVGCTCGQKGCAHIEAVLKS